MGKGIYVRLEPELLKRLRTRARKENVTVQEVLRKSAEYYLGPDLAKAGNVKEALVHMRASLDYALASMPVGNIEGLTNLKK
jgi:hypothetical protein